MKKVSEPETVAEHAFRVVVLCLALAQTLGVDQEKLVKMAIIHDLGETSTGDIVVEKGKIVDKEKKIKKEKIEKNAIREILWGFGEDYGVLFQEMIEGKSPEARAFWQIDKLEMAIQAYEYEKNQTVDLKEFIDNADMHIVDPILKNTINELKRLRK